MSFAPCRQLALMASLLISGTTCWAQSSTGTVLGTILDPPNLVLPGAPVQLLNLATNDPSFQNVAAIASADAVQRFQDTGQQFLRRVWARQRRPGEPGIEIQDQSVSWELV